MKPNATPRSVVSTLQGEKVGMSIDESALAHIMSVLTDLYSDPEMAVIREYSTNAYDAHVEAGVTRPIEITLPSNLSPYLVIQDFGTGLDIEDIRNIYSRYGTSTKRDTNDLVGTLGLGCKSALTYTDQFTLSGVKNGVCTQVSVSRDEDGSGSMTIVAEYETDEPSGVTITIPVKRWNSFTEKAGYFFQFWGEGTVLVNGEEPKRIEGIALDDDILAVRPNVLGHHVLVMGNVPYPVDLPFNFKVVARVPIGAVQFTPSRESLQMTSLTKQTIEEIVKRVEEGQQTAIEKIVAEASNKIEALRAALEAESLFRYKGTLKYRKREIPAEFRVDPLSNDGEIKTMTLVNAGRRRYYSNQETRSSFPINIVPKTIFITGYNQKNFTTYFRQKLNAWWREVKQEYSEMTVEHFLLVETLPNSEWIDPTQVRTWEEVKATKLAQAKRQDGRPAGAYRAYAGGSYVTLQADEIDTTNPIFYFVGSYDSNTMLVREENPNATFVELSSNRVAKFMRTFPTAKNVTEAAKEMAQTWADSLTEEECLALHLHDEGRYTRSLLNELDEARIDDPDLQMVIDLSRQDVSKTLLEQRKKYWYLYELPEFTYDNPVEKYPLLDAYMECGHYWNTEKQCSAREHLYTYLNAAFAAAEMETV